VRGADPIVRTTSNELFSRHPRPYRYWLAHCFLAATLTAVASSCGGKADPWSGISLQEREAIERHRNLGIALLESSLTKQSQEHFAKSVSSPGQKPPTNLELAADEFRAITRSAPKLALGWGNVAVTEMQMSPAPLDDALAAAQEARRLLPHN